LIINKTNVLVLSITSGGQTGNARDNLVITTSGIKIHSHRKSCHTTENHYDHKSVYQQQQQQQQHTTYPTTTHAGCTLLTNTTHYHAKMRFIVFQRDSSEQLHDLIVYYSQVVPLDSLVVIDHLGENERTKQILNLYSSMGMHVWRCEKEWDLKEKMWTSVVQVYQNTSDFVFPIDVDEYLAVKTYDEEDQKGKPKLVWTRKALYKELDTLLEQYDGRPFKTWWTQPVSPDCPSLSDSGLESNQQLIPLNSFHSKQCSISEAVEDPDYYCMAKVFTKGSEYVSTDTGNHFGATSKLKGNPDLFQACRKYITDKKLPNPYFQTNLSLVHMQDLTFHDWVMHHMRGASSYDFNKFGREMAQMECKYRKGSHYCRSWVAMAKTNFGYWNMESVFQEMQCPHSENRPLFIAGLFSSLCNKVKLTFD
jgi:hypothetical protein